MAIPVAQFVLVNNDNNKNNKKNKKNKENYIDRNNNRNRNKNSIADLCLSTNPRSKCVRY